MQLLLSLALVVTWNRPSEGMSESLAWPYVLYCVRGESLEITIEHKKALFNTVASVLECSQPFLEQSPLSSASMSIERK